MEEHTQLHVADCRPALLQLAAYMHHAKVSPELKEFLPQFGGFHDFRWNQEVAPEGADAAKACPERVGKGDACFLPEWAARILESSTNQAEGGEDDGVSLQYVPPRVGCANLPNNASGSGPSLPTSVIDAALARICWPPVGLTVPSSGYLSGSSGFSPSHGQHLPSRRERSSFDGNAPTGREDVIHGFESVTETAAGPRKPLVEEARRHREASDKRFVTLPEIASARSELSRYADAHSKGWSF